jgi:hypothetical protein
MLACRLFIIPNQELESTDVRVHYKEQSTNVRWKDNRYLLHESKETHECTFDSVQSFLVPASGDRNRVFKTNTRHCEQQELGEFVWQFCVAWRHIPWLVQRACRTNRMAAVPNWHRIEPKGKFSYHNQKFVIKWNKEDLTYICGSSLDFLSKIF